MGREMRMSLCTGLHFIVSFHGGVSVLSDGSALAQALATRVFHQEKMISTSLLPNVRAVAVLRMVVIVFHLAMRSLPR